PYDASHVIGQLQLLIFAMLAFVFLMWAKLYPPEIRSTVLNTDWFYRRLAPMLVRPLVAAFLAGAGAFERAAVALGQRLSRASETLADHPVAGPVVPGPAAVVQLGLLTLILVVIYVVLG
ncbi:MAG: Na(+)/H(+) antiporter subunit D, partial [Candidatus Puniceispirillales bacterium]